MRKAPQIPDNDHFHFVNRNPFGYYTTDCVVRAFSSFFDMSWAEAYSRLSLWGIAHGVMFNWPQCYVQYLNELGFKKNTPPRSRDKEANTIAAFLRKADPKKRYLIETRRHLTVIIGGKIWDIGDCSYLTVKHYWEMPETEIIS